MTEPSRRRQLLVGLMVALALVGLFMLEGWNREGFEPPPEGASPPEAPSPTFTPAPAVAPPALEHSIPAGVLEASLPGCEGVLTLKLESAVSLRSAAKHGWDVEYQAAITDGEARFQGLPPLLYWLYVGDHYVGKALLTETKGDSFQGACSDDCAISVEVLTDGCAEDVLVELEDWDEAVLDGQVVAAGMAGASMLWTELTCNGLYRVRAEASGCTPTVAVMSLLEPLQQARMFLEESYPYPVRVVDFWTGEAIADAEALWSRPPGFHSQFLAGPWNGHDDIILVEAPNKSWLHVEAEGYMPRWLRREPDLEPDEFAVLELEPVDVVEVLCSIDDEPCDPQQVDVLSIYSRGAGMPKEGWCEPTKPKGTYLCPAGLLGLDGPIRGHDLGKPKLEAWAERRRIGSHIWNYPLPEPLHLEITTDDEPKVGPRSHVCAQLPPEQSTGCAFRVAPGGRPDVNFFSVVQRYIPGTEREIGVPAGTDALLTCDDGSAMLQTRDVGCDEPELDPYGSVCVVHEPAQRCDIRRDGPYPHEGVKGCDGEVIPGSWRVSCHGGEVDGKIDFVKCGTIEVVAGETTDIECW